MSGPNITFDNAADRIGQEIGVTDWLRITQDQVDSFAESTRDPDWIHVDPERAARESPFGQTVAHGFLTLSLLSHFAHEADLWPADTAYALNYGSNRVRFLAPVPVGRRVRGRFVLKDVRVKDNGGHLMTYDARVEIEGQDTPAMTAEFLVLYFPKQAAA